MEKPHFRGFFFICFYLCHLLIHDKIIYRSQVIFDISPVSEISIIVGIDLIP